jgi:hypothetical protein
LIAEREEPELSYELVDGDGGRYLSVTSIWWADRQLNRGCAGATATEIRKAIEAFVTECDPTLMGRWDARCELSGWNPSDNVCPNPAQ